MPTNTTKYTRINRVLTGFVRKPNTLRRSCDNGIRKWTISRDRKQGKKLLRDTYGGFRVPMIYECSFMSSKFLTCLTDPHVHVNTWESCDSFTYLGQRAEFWKLIPNLSRRLVSPRITTRYS